jgi:hypothetical protein
VPASDNPTAYMFHFATPCFFIAYLVSGVLPLLFFKIKLTSVPKIPISEESELKNLSEKFEIDDNLD